jgi:hypothetical protein
MQLLFEIFSKAATSTNKEAYLIFFDNKFDLSFNFINLYRFLFIISQMSSYGYFLYIIDSRCKFLKWIVYLSACNCYLFWSPLDWYASLIHTNNSLVNNNLLSSRIIPKTLNLSSFSSNN